MERLLEMKANFMDNLRQAALVPNQEFKGSMLSEMRFVGGHSTVGVAGQASY